MTRPPMSQGMRAHCSLWVLAAPDVTGHARTLFSVGIGSSRRCVYSRVHGACVYTCACARSRQQWNGRGGKKNEGQRLKGKREGREKPVRNWNPSRGETSSARTMGSRANCSSSSTCRPVCCVSPGLRHQTAHARRLRPDRVRGKVLHAAFSAVLDAFDRLSLVARYPDERLSEALHAPPCPGQFEQTGLKTNDRGSNRLQGLIFSVAVD
jgi:hypothetical protein